MKRDIYRQMLTLLLMLVVSACSVSKNIKSPELSLPTNFRNGTSDDTNGIAVMPWENFFTDEQLIELINKAIANNYDMQLAMKNIDAAKLLVGQVKWNYVPALGINVTASTDRPANSSLNGLSLQQYGIGNHIEDYSANLSLSWEADIWNKIGNRKKQARAQYLQSVEARNLVQTNLVYNIAQGYFNLLMLDDQLSIAQRNMALDDSTLRIIRLQYEAGQVTLLAIQQAQAQRQAAAELIPQFEQNITIQENALSILIGENPRKISRTKTLGQVVFPDNLSDGIPSSLVGHRPDVKTQELALAVADAKVGITKAEMYPALRITASGGVNSFKASNWFNIPASLFGIVAGSIAQPLIQHKELKTNYKIALLQRDEAVISFRRSVLVAVGEVSDALAKIEKLQQQESIVSNRVETLQGATSNADMLFKSGLATYLEVITAQANVLQSELELTAIKRSRLTAVADLYRSLGGGWK